MEFVTIPTEQTTAITDAILGFEALTLMWYLQQYALRERWRVRLWQIVLAFTAVVAFAGSYVHGVVMPKTTYELLWIPLLLLLGLLVANVVLVAVYDLFGINTVKRLWPWLLAMAVGFFALTRVPGMTFLIFILYEALAMLFALGCYGILAWRQGLPGAGIIAGGIVLQIVAAAAQASGPFEISMIWTFDHNGIFHLIGMVANFVMIVGVAKGFQLSSG
jgi:hypothetical protein